MTTLIFGDKGACFDWICRSVSIDHDPKNRVNKGRAFLPIFQAGDTKVGILCIAQIEHWAFALFTLARTLGGLDQLAATFRPFCWEVCSDSFSQRPMHAALAAMGAIATYVDKINDNTAEPMARHLCALWEDPKLPRGLRGLLGVLLTTGLARFTGRHHAEYAEDILLSGCEFCLLP
jgi:hypothetical protein